MRRFVEGTDRGQSALFPPSASHRARCRSSRRRCPGLLTSHPSQCVMSQMGCTKIVENSGNHQRVLIIWLWIQRNSINSAALWPHRAANLVLAARLRVGCSLLPIIGDRLPGIEVPPTLPVALPADVDKSMLPKLAPTKPPMMLRSPLPLTVENGAVDDPSWIEPTEIALADAADRGRRARRRDRAAGEAGEATDSAGKLMKVALAPAKPPTALLVLHLALDRVEFDQLRRGIRSTPTAPASDLRRRSAASDQNRTAHF